MNINLHKRIKHKIKVRKDVNFMAVLTDQNLVTYKKYIDDLQTQIKAWNTYLSSAERALNSSTGSTFRSKYAKGKKATTNIQSIIDILQFHSLFPFCIFTK